jgi:sugar lactone lactonase YvrE
MKSFILCTFALSVSLAAALLSSCGGLQLAIWSPHLFSSGAYSPSSRPLIASALQSPARVAKTPGYKVSGPLLYVSNFESPPYDGVTIYNAKENNPSPVAVINENIFEPDGDCIDADGTLYVANDPGSGPGWVSEYALGTTKTLRVITDGINFPAFCAIDSSGNLWVTNVGGPVTEYLKGSTVPHFTLTNGLTNPDGLAIDHSGNVYVGNLNAPYAQSNVQVYPPGKTSPSRTITDGIRWPVGIGVDAQGTLYVTNDVPPCSIEEYPAGKSHPYQTISKDIDDPTAVTFEPAGRMYLVSEGKLGCSNNGRWPAILEFRPDTLSRTNRMISNDLHTPVDAAYYPPLLP